MSPRIPNFVTECPDSSVSCGICRRHTKATVFVEHGKYFVTHTFPCHFTNEEIKDGLKKCKECDLGTSPACHATGICTKRLHP